MNRIVFSALAALSIAAIPAFGQAKNVILFIGDGAGVSSLNAAGIYGYGKPQALYLQKMPHVALADTSTAKEWVSDAAASATAWATGYKGRNGVISQSPTAERGVKDGETLKTVLEYAAERGLATGIISNDERTGVTIATVAAFYAHSNNRQASADIFMQMLNPRFGNGPEIVIGTGRKWITEQTAKAGRNLAGEIASKGYTYLDSLAAVSQFGRLAEPRDLPVRRYRVRFQSGGRTGRGEAFAKSQRVSAAGLQRLSSGEGSQEPQPHRGAR